MKSNPKTIEEWRSERRRRAKQENGFIRIPMELWNGEAFHALTKSEKLILIECLAQLRYAPKSSKKRKGLNIYQCGLGGLLNNGEFGLPTKYLQERGIKGQDTIAKAKRRLVQIGFLDVVTPGSFTKAGRFKYSDRWRTYNSAALINENGAPNYDGPLPGYCHYANITQYNADRANKAIEHNSNDTPRQLDLFIDYADTAKSKSHKNSGGYGTYMRCAKNEQSPPFCDVQKSKKSYERFLDYQRNKGSLGWIFAQENLLMEFHVIQSEPDVGLRQ